MRALWILTVALAVMMAGCLNVPEDDGDQGDDDRDNEASVDFSGEGAGSDSDTAECNQDGQLSLGGTIEDGNVTVVVTDGGGATLHNGTYEDFLEVDTVSLDGTSGPWTLTVTRDDGFDGSYAILLGC